MSEQAERFYSEMYSVQDNRISWGEYIARLYDTDEIELLTEQEIVRCKDCKQMRDWTKDELADSYDKEELADGWCMFLRIGTYDDFFCAWGVRRDE